MILEPFLALKTVVDTIGLARFDSCTDKDESSKYCFVQYSEPIQQHELKPDGVEKALGCVKMQL